ncbi:MAG: exopolysaccharide biosynthesis polyprenyl glycosylphosphotransferase [Pseudomonadota bacterium]
MVREQELAFAEKRQAEMSNGRLFGDSLNRREALRLLSYGSMLVSDLASIQAGFAIAAHWRGAYWLQLYGFPISIMFCVIYAFLALSSGSVTREAFGSRLRSAMLGERTLLMASALCIAILFFQPHGLTLSRLSLLTAIVLSGLFIGVGRILFLSLFLQNRDEFWTSCVVLLDGAPPLPGSASKVVDVRAEGIDPERGDPAVVARLGALLAGFDQAIVVCDDSERANAWSLMLKAFDIKAEVIVPSSLPIGAVGVGRYADRPTLIVNRGQLSLANRIKKRVVDILFSAFALLLLLPVLIIVAIAIKLDSPGPVLFRQLRVGYGNRPFQIFKFRSLRHEATDRDGNKSVSVGDSRVTRVGAFIRRTSIDELPQLFNVLLGDMSLVGPRPHALGSRAGEKLFWEIDPNYWQRHALKPGITGLAQIRGFRGETQAQEDLTQRLNSDIEYLEGWTLWRDFRIMIGTVRVLVHNKAF